MPVMTHSSAVRAHYRISAADAVEARDLADAMAREQTLEVPPGAAPPAIEDRFLGRVVQVEPYARSGGGPDRWSVSVDYSTELLDGTATQFLNLVWGNVSLMDHVLLVDLDIPDTVLDTFPGPGPGQEGIRALVSAPAHRPLVSSALKPVGLTTDAIVSIARKLTAAGMDLIKDDHSLANQATAPFRERIEAVSHAIRETNAAAGTSTAYLPNATAPLHEMLERVAFAQSCGCGGVVISPGLTGLDAMRAVRERFPDMGIMAHPSHANTSPNATHGIAPPLLMGTLWRLFGADMLIYVNARGRFAWPLEACKAINERARAPLGRHRTAFPVPAGGVQAADAAHWVDVYGPDTLLLVGGSILEASDVEARARAVVQAVAGVAAPSTGA